jgi:uncharacterized cupin superfamily protein
MSISKWFTSNLSEVEGMKHPTLGMGYLFGEAYPRERFQDFGINVRVVEPGQPTALYHAEDAEEAFIVLGGECLAIVEGEELTMRKWDFLHCPPGTAHVLIGAGDGPCTILMVGGRGGEMKIHYPVNETAARHGVSVERETDSFEDAWEQVGLRPEFEMAPLPWPPR